MPRSCACGAAWLACWLLVTGAGSTAHNVAPEQPLGAQLPFVPDVPGAEEARAWLVAHQGERQQRGQGPPAWPASLSLPSCDQLSEQPQEEQQRWLEQGLHGRGASWEGQLQPTRHMILATVSDAWGPDASRNGCEEKRALPPARPAWQRSHCHTACMHMRQAWSPAVSNHLLPRPAACFVSAPHTCAQRNKCTHAFLQSSGRRWMDDPHLASTFDLVVIYYGDNHNFSCPQCLHVFRRARTVK